MGCVGVGMLAGESVVLQRGRPVKNDVMDCWRLASGVSGCGTCMEELDAGVC